MANGQKNSIALTMLRYIYHGLGQVASHPDHSSQANPCFPIHYVVGWLAEIFPTLYSQRPDSECTTHYPALICYARVSTK